MKKAIILPVVILFAAFIVMAFNSGKSDTRKEYAFLKVYHSSTTAANAKMVLVFPDGRNETVSLDLNSPRHFEANSVKITDGINKLARQGFKIVFSGGNSDSPEYVFEKE